MTPKRSRILMMDTAYNKILGLVTSFDEQPPLISQERCGNARKFKVQVMFCKESMRILPESSFNLVV